MIHDRTPIVRAPRVQQYVHVHNDDVRDERLSFRARGLLIFLLSLPKDADWTAEQLAAHTPETVEEVRAAMRELQANGYGTEDAED